MGVSKGIRFSPELKEKIEESANLYSKGKFARECKRLIEIGLNNLKAVVESDTMTFEKILKAVSLITNVSIPAIHLKTNKSEIVEARQLCHYVAHDKELGSLQYIGDNIGQKDHTTVMHSIKRVNDLKSYNKRINTLLVDIEKILNNN